MIRRICVKGTSGSGKSTLAAELARRLDLQYVELDALFWGPNWRESTAEQLRAHVDATLDDARGWVVDGNYDSQLERSLLDRAELVVWLDLPLSTKLARITLRTFARWLRKEELWNSNRESLRQFLWGKKSLVAWAVQTHFRHRRDWPQRFARIPYVRLRTPAEVRAWLAGVAPG